MPGVKPFAPDTRRDDKAVSVPCAPQQERAGPNSHIHVLKHAGLAPALASGARRALRRKSKNNSSGHPAREEKGAVRRSVRCSSRVAFLSPQIRCDK